jgi:cysteinyl-tRNA synthetase
MSEPRLYNTLTRRADPLETGDPAKVGVYVCGPTTYDVPHAGHARAAVAFDTLVRHLSALGFDVTYVRNITDVDDKILQRSAETGEPPLELSRRMAEIYQAQMRSLGCLEPTHEPRVSEHIPQVIDLVSRLVEHGAGYVVDMPGGTHDVYFSVRSFAGYGKLSRRKLDELRVGARVAEDENKRDPLDFALWKGAASDEWGWDSPWGRGRPGWHIECSAMATHYLGHSFDIHAGGMDLIFPHHENEIAQSEAARPGQGPYVRRWMHNGFVNVDKEKMSKSLGNFVTLTDVLERNDPEGFRWFLLSVHYRGPIQFDTDQLPDGRVVFPGVDEAERRVDYVYATLRRLGELTASGMTVPAKLPKELRGYRDAANQAAEQARDALNDDLNTPVALAALGELARIGNEICDLSAKRRKDKTFVGASTLAAQSVLAAMRKVVGPLGLIQSTARDYGARTTERRLRLRGLTAEQIYAKLEERAQARRDQDFARSDQIRDELGRWGISLRDTPGGTDWSIDA